MTRALVIGYGSIGRRHARVLAEMGVNVGVVSAAKDVPFSVWRLLSEAVAAHQPDYVVVATETARHAAVLQDLDALAFGGRILVEKPVIAGRDQNLPKRLLDQISVGYNLRFHNCIDATIHAVADRRILAMTAYVGQYLPDWRPESDYRASYSARRGDGGVLRDLSHELDYVQFLGGTWRRVAAAGGKLSDLDVDSEDCVGLLMELEHCPLAMVHLNYLDRAARRILTVNHEGGTIITDFVAGSIAENGVVREVQVDRDGTMARMHSAAISGDHVRLCDARQGIATVQLIGAAERAIDERRWVSTYDAEASGRVQPQET